MRTYLPRIDEWAVGYHRDSKGLTRQTQVFANALQAVAIVLVFEGGAGFHFTEIVEKYGPEPIEKFLKVKRHKTTCQTSTNSLLTNP